MTDLSPSSTLYMIGPGANPALSSADELGNKAFNLLRMAAAGFPVPYGFVLPTTWCGRFRDGVPPMAELNAALAEGVAKLERLTGRGFGSGRQPLLLSVRSGAKVSMPGNDGNRARHWHERTNG